MGLKRGQQGETLEEQDERRDEQDESRGAQVRSGDRIQGRPEPGKDIARRMGRMLRRILPYLRPYRRLGGSSVGLVVLSALFALLEPWPLALLVDSVLGDKPAPSFLTDLFGDGTFVLLLVAVALGFVFAAGVNGAAVLSEYVNTKLNERLVLDFRSDLFRHMHRLSLSFLEGQRAGGMMNRIQMQAGKLGQVVLAMPPLAESAITLAGMFFITYQIDPQLALVAATVVPLIYYSVGFYMKRVEPQIRRVRELEMRSMSIIHEALTMFRVIVAFGRESHEYGRFRRQGEVAVDARVKLTVRQTLFSMAVNVITAAGTAFVLGLGGYNVLRGRLTVGQLLVVISYIAAVYTPIQSISSSLATLQEQMIGLEMSFSILDREPDVKDAPDAVAIDRAKGNVRFENVSFSYEGRKGTLQDISFEAKTGQAVALVGPTGAGKSTLVSLIARFYDPQKGRVTLDDQDLRKVTVESLRRQVSIVLQEPLLFSGTIAENIRYGRLDASMEEVIAAAKAANAHEFIMALPKKYETLLGERGARLSGGERQRISIARAFIKDAPILILDEPTSSIDSKTEEVILDALQRLVEGRTTFMIAHRLSTVRAAELHLVVDHGRLVEQGTRQELLAKKGLFREMFEAQVGKDPGRRADLAARRKHRISAIGERLRSADADARRRARGALWKLDRREVRQWVLSTLTSKDPEELWGVAAVVRAGRFKALVSPLLERTASLSPEAAAPLRKALEGLDLDTPELAEIAARAPETDRADAIRVVHEIAGDGLAHEGVLEPLLLDPEPTARVAALEILADAATPEAADVAEELLRQETHPDARAAGVRVLGRGGTLERRRAWLPYCIVDPAPKVRAASFELLPARLSGREAVFVVRGLVDPDESVWREARRVTMLLPPLDLGLVAGCLKMLSKASASAITDVLGPHDGGRFSGIGLQAALAAAVFEAEPDDPVVRKEAAVRLGLPASRMRLLEKEGKLVPNDHRFGRRVVSAYNEEDVARVAASSAGGARRHRDGSFAHTWRQLRRLIVHRPNPEEPGVVIVQQVLARLAGPAPFLRLLKSTLEADMRAPVLEALTAIGDQGGIDGLIRALSDPSLRVRLRAAELLGGLGSPRGIEALRRMHKEASRSRFSRESRAERLAAEQALLASGGGLEARTPMELVG